MANLSQKEGTGSSVQFLQGGGEMGERIRHYDWESTPLGHPAAWPLSLKTAVGIMLNSQVAMHIAWGPTYVQLYNDAYRSILGSDKHPEALGKVTPESWHEVWDFVGPIYERIMTAGEAVRFDNQVFTLFRNGFAEECYFTFSYSPLTDEAGRTTGVMATIWETSENVIKFTIQKHSGSFRKNLLALILSTRYIWHSSKSSLLVTRIFHTRSGMSLGNTAIP